MTGTSDDGGEDGARGIVTGESGLAHTTAIVDDQRGYLFVAHVELAESWWIRLRYEE